MPATGARPKETKINLMDCICLCRGVGISNGLCSVNSRCSLKTVGDDKKYLRLLTLFFETCSCMSIRTNYFFELYRARKQFRNFPSRHILHALI